MRRIRSPSAAGTSRNTSSAFAAAGLPVSRMSRCFAIPAPPRPRSILLRARVLHVLDRRQYRVADAAAFELGALADIDVLDRVMRHRIEAEWSARGVELHF